MAKTELADVLALLVDIGAVGNLGSDSFMRTVAETAIKFGYASKQAKMNNPLTVSGVGHGTQSAEWRTTVPVCVRDLDSGEILMSDYTAPTIPNADTPGLLGLASIMRMRGIVDTFSDPPLLISVGEGGYKLDLSPGSRRFALRRAPSGHLMLPISLYKEFREQGSTEQRREEVLRPKAAGPHLVTELYE